MTARPIGLDLGGTKLLGVVIDESGAVLAERRTATPADGPGVVAAMEWVVAGLLDDVGCAAASVGIGAAGIVDCDGILRFGPNLPGILDLDLAGELAPRLGVGVWVDNDATCAGLAEWLIGAARGSRNALVVALGTGIGGAVILDGSLRRGAHCMAGEFGHLLVDPSGPQCGCGQRGCWEQYASGNALGRLGREAAERGEAPSLLAESNDDVGAIGGEVVAAAAQRGAPDALAVLDTFARWVAVGLAGLVNIADPEQIVIGGGLAEMGDLLLDPVRQHLGLLTVGAASRPPVPLIVAAAGEQAAAIGAALLPRLQAVH